MNNLTEYLDKYLSFYTEGHAAAAHALATHYGSLGAISAANERELLLISAVDHTVVHALKLLAYIYGRSVKDSFNLPCRVNEGEICSLLRALYSGVACERIYCLLFDKKDRLSAIELLGEGIANYSEIYPRKVLDVAKESGAGSLIISHNHPHGTTDPSIADVNGTARIKSMLESAGITFIGHYVVSDSGCKKIEGV